jgi:hypothetical protein
VTEETSSSGRSGRRPPWPSWWTRRCEQLLASSTFVADPTARAALYGSIGMRGELRPPQLCGRARRAADDEHGCVVVVEIKVKRGEIGKGKRTASSNPRKYSQNNEPRLVGWASWKRKYKKERKNRKGEEKAIIKSTQKTQNHRAGCRSG